MKCVSEVFLSTGTQKHNCIRNSCLRERLAVASEEPKKDILIELSALCVFDQHFIRSRFNGRCGVLEGVFDFQGN